MPNEQRWWTAGQSLVRCDQAQSIATDDSQHNRLRQIIPSILRRRPSCIRKLSRILPNELIIQAASRSTGCCEFFRSATVAARRGRPARRSGRSVPAESRPRQCLSHISHIHAGALLSADCRQRACAARRTRRSDRVRHPPGTGHDATVCVRERNAPTCCGQLRKRRYACRSVPTSPARAGHGALSGPHRLGV